MRKITFRFFSFLFAVLVLMLSFSACSAEEKTDYNSSLSSPGGAELDKESYENSDSLSDLGETAGAGRKIIETINLSLQTKEFDDLLEKIDREIAALGGYVETSNISGRQMNSNSNRHASMTVRIPAKKSSDFSGFLSENSVVTQRSVTTEDVTLNYVDIESRVKALTLEKEALETLLQKAGTVNEIISIRGKLTEVIYQIESYQSRLRAYDNLVDYCTVNMNINEVERTAVVEKQTMWQEIGTNLGNNFASLGEGLRAFTVFLISAIPFLLPLIVIGALILVIAGGRRKKRKGNASQEKESASSEKINH